MPAPLRLGFLTRLHGVAEPRKLYRDYVELFAAAEELGFDSCWVAQHHFDASAGGLPSPFPFLAAVAERTRRIRLGTRRTGGRASPGHGPAAAASSA
jgi:alkanesulfonate monooxygenase SsuD/methylene tetrahydromethanopterin reductase-like flavin-dependent oxidoreductase (luciferase family)